MANYRLKLSDGTTTIDFYSGSDAIVRMFGLHMPPPEMESEYISSPEFDGDRLARSRYKNRTIGITLKVVGTSLSDLQANIRSIHRLLNDARQRTLRGYGAQVYLEYQWGDSAGQSVFFDVLQGELVLPANYFSPWLTANWTIVNAVLNLECKPLGRFTNQDIAQATLENEDYDTNHNYQDIAAAAGHGDIPAKMYWKLAMSEATGDKKVWLAKRSGSRYDDDLWIQGEDEDGTTELTGGGVTFSDETDASQSGGKYKRSKLAAGAGGYPADTEISRINYDFATPPRGQFRVLVRCRCTNPADASEYARMAWGMGYSYGDKSKTPSEVKGEYFAVSADNIWEILDLGILNIPPIAESKIATNNTFQLRIYQYTKEALETGSDGTESPTGHNDPDSAWSNEANAYDEVIGTYAVTTNYFTNQWCSFIELSISAVDCAGVKFHADRENERINSIDIDAHYAGEAAGTWHDLYEGSFADATWVSKYFSDGNHSVDKIRFRFYEPGNGNDKAQLNEVDFITPNSSHQWDLDYIFLLPIDEGVVIIDDVNASDVIAIDGITDPPNVFILDGSGNIEDYPDYVGKPFTLGREDTRLYVLRDDVKGVTFASDVKYQPQFLVI